MLTTRCFCQLTFEGRDDDDLVGAMVKHLEEAHAIQVSTVTARNAIERQRVLGPAPERVVDLETVTTRHLSPGLTDDFLELFDDIGFTDNIGWASCYCMYHHLDSATWGERSWQQNRAEIAERIWTGKTTGILAYSGESVAGWVNATRLSEYLPHRHGDARDDTTGAIVCFVVGPAYRGHGLGTLLLDAACDLLRDAGLTGVEAYPAERSSSPASAYHGTPEMYRRAGFAHAGEGVVFRIL